MFVLLLCMALSTSDVDHACRQKFGHPGDLGITAEAEQLFTGNTSYIEASATIGELGTEVPSSNPDTKVYSWQNGKLEMQFRSDRLDRYRLDGKWKVLRIPTDAAKPDLAARATQIGFGDTNQPANDQNRKQEFESFQRSVVEIIEIGSQATQTNLERSDIKALKYHMAKLSQAIAANDWKQADNIRDSMKISLGRSNAVAIDTQRRLTERKRADEERRHQEEMLHRERHQQEILFELRMRGSY